MAQLRKHCSQSREAGACREDPGYEQETVVVKNTGRDAHATF